MDPEVVNKYCNKEHALCVLNHSGDVDWMVGWCLIDQMCMLGVRCMYVCMYIGIHVRRYVCVYVCMYVCMHAMYM